MIVIPYMIGDVVVAANAVILPKLQLVNSRIVGLNYQYGPFLEVCETIMQATKNDTTSAKKYPLVCLVLPITENSTAGVVGIDQNTPITLIIATYSNNTDKSAARYAKNFVPILYPIVDEILEQFDNDGRFLFEITPMINHTKTDYPYWGGAPDAKDAQKANPFGDWCDAIELKINLKILTPNCN